MQSVFDMLYTSAFFTLVFFQTSGNFQRYLSFINPRIIKCVESYRPISVLSQTILASGLGLLREKF